MGGARSARWDETAGDDLFRRIGSFLADHRLSPEPNHYAFAYRVLSDSTGPIARAVEQISEGGVRLSRQEIEQLGGTPTPGAPMGRTARATETPVVAFAPDPPAPVDEAVLLAARAQVEGFGDMVRSIQDEQRDFGLNLQASADAMRAGADLLGLSGIVGLTTTMIDRVNASERRLHLATQEVDVLRAQLEEAQGSARCDPLTGLANRRALAEAFAAITSDDRACLAVCDVDRFKAVNDGFGHAVGDRVLTAIGQMLEAACPGHLTARYGGEEFAVLFTGVDPASAHATIEAARIAVARRRFRDRDSGAPLGEITFSAGLGTVVAGDTLDSAFRRADRALYRAKAEGRNRIEVAEAPIAGA
jgi:diguanylate cyclase